MIVLTCRNNIELSKKCFQTLLSQDKSPKILLIDNASTDGTAAWARGEQQKHRGRMFVMTFAQPESVSKVWNRALDFAWGLGEKQALVVNNDTELRPDTYEWLRWMDPEAGMTTCVSVRERERMVLPVDWEPPEASPHPDYSCFMIRKWAHERVRFDEACVGAFYEDNCHHVEMHRAGIEAVNIGLPFLHHGSMTLKHAGPGERERIEANAALNREYFHRKYGCYPGTKKYEQLFC